MNQSIRQNKFVSEISELGRAHNFRDHGGSREHTFVSNRFGVVTQVWQDGIEYALATPLDRKSLDVLKRLWLGEPVRPDVRVNATVHIGHDTEEDYLNGSHGYLVRGNPSALLWTMHAMVVFPHSTREHLNVAPSGSVVMIYNHDNLAEGRTFDVADVKLHRACKPRSSVNCAIMIKSVITAIVGSEDEEVKWPGVSYDNGQIQIPDWIRGVIRRSKDAEASLLRHLLRWSRPKSAEAS